MSMENDIRIEEQLKRIADRSARIKNMGAEADRIIKHVQNKLQNSGIQISASLAYKIENEGHSLRLMNSVEQQEDRKLLDYGYIDLGWCKSEDPAIW